jgi:hypothetical protein
VADLETVQAGNRARLDQLHAAGISPNPVALLMARLHVLEELLLEPAQRVELELGYEEELTTHLESLLALAKEREREARRAKLYRGRA